MPPKKDKGKKKKGQEPGDKEALEEVDKEFYELQVADLNRKLARLKFRCTELEEEYEDTKKALQKLDEDSADIIAYLKRTLQAKADEIGELQERLTALQQARDTEKAMFLERIKNMENDFKIMHEQLTSEIKLLNGKLNSLEEFRSQREELMNKFLTQEDAMAEQEKRHKQTLYEVERKFIIAKDELKKDMESKLLQLSLDFQNATQMRIAATTQRVIRENVAVNNELSSLMESWRQLTDDVAALKEKDKTMRLEIDLHKDEKLQVLKRNEIQGKVIDRISREYERLLSRFNQMSHFEKKSELLESQLMETKTVLKAETDKAQKTLQLLHATENERIVYNQRLHDAITETNRLQGVLTSAAKAVMEAAIIEQAPSDDEAYNLSKRQSLLSTLLELFDKIGVKKRQEVEPITSTETMFGSQLMRHIYEMGDLGIISRLDNKPPAQTRMNVDKVKSISAMLSVDQITSGIMTPKHQSKPRIETAKSSPSKSIDSHAKKE